jgi:hypothetical protein
MAENGRVADEGKKSHCFYGKSSITLSQWYSMGSCKTNNVKIHHSQRFGLKLKKKKVFTLSTCSKNIKRSILQYSSK